MEVISLGAARQSSYRDETRLTMYAEQRSQSMLSSKGSKLHAREIPSQGTCLLALEELPGLPGVRVHGGFHQYAKRWCSSP